jgi:hypothetical protein
MIAHNVSTVTETGSALVEKVRSEYLAGESVWSLQMRYSAVLKRSEVKRILSDIMRPQGGQMNPDPTEEEIVALREATKAKWTDEVASRRWVGRYLSRPETAGEAMSRILRGMGGDC